VSLARLAWVSEHDRLALYTPGPPHLAFHRSAHPRRLIRAGNGTGKTRACAQEAWWHALGAHPHKRVMRAPTVGIIACADYTGGYLDVIAPTLWECCPEWALKPGARYSRGSGWKNDIIELRNGSVIVFRSGKAGSSSSAGVNAHWLWIDEPLDAGPWSELIERARLERDGLRAPAWHSMTPIGRPLGWHRLHVEGDPSRGVAAAEDWEQHRIRQSTADCPWRGEAFWRERQAGYLRTEWAQRVEGEWEGPTTGRTLDGWSDDLLDAAIPEADWMIGLGIDHGERAGSEVAILLMWQPGRPILWVLDEWESEHATEPAEDARHIRAMLQRNGLTVASLDLVLGDVNSAGKSGIAGRSVNDLLGAELGVTVRKPSKRPGSVDYGCRLVNVALRRGHLRVHPRCRGLAHSAAHWQGKDDDLKHRIDALRYVAVPVLEALYSPAELDRLRIA